MVIDEVRNSIENCLRNHGIPSEVCIVNFNNCIQVSDDLLDLWIRFLPISGDDKYQVEISSVAFTDEYRRKGIFTDLFEVIEKVEGVGKVMISSVCTDSMLNWCNKNNLVSNNTVDYYKEV